MHGSGIYDFPDDLTTYVGDFENDRFHGEGILKYANDASYSGSFKFGKMNGYGVKE